MSDWKAALVSIAHRLTALPPAKRQLRMMPVLIPFLAVFAHGLTLSAYYANRHGVAAIIAWVCVIGIWRIYRDDLEMAARGEPTTADTGVMHWWLELPMGILLTRIAASLLNPADSRSPGGTPIPAQPPAITLITVLLVGAFVVNLVQWWYRFIRDVCVPSEGWTGRVEKEPV